MMEAVRTSETSVDNHFTRQYNPEDSSEHNIVYYKPHTELPCDKSGLIEHVYSGMLANPTDSFVVTSTCKFCP
jgi:hypothetical protein